ncbi:hypothetical protein M0R04_07165 [Candidatus Dojkabacteria bacterium]|jgi:hypothetical protein|nr:hypothetical protein [Candidatus Dojkabacteria bacterium]
MKLFEIAKPKINWNTKSEKQQIAMVKRKGCNIKKISNPSETVKLAAVWNDASALQYIDNKSEALQLMAVKQWGPAIVYILNPSEAVQMAAVKCISGSIQYIEHPKDSVIKTALTDPGFIFQSDNYNKEVMRIFKDNTLLMKKWIRYGKVMRNQE